MLSEILKIQPKLDNKDLNNMEKTLSQRFSRIAKGFGKGLKVASALALGAAVIDKLINPLQEVKAAIDRTLGKADDVVTNARQFNTTTENLLKVRALGSVRGVSNENIDLLLTKFQGAVAQASANPDDPANSAVRNYVGEKDTALAFYNFIIQLQKMDANQRTLIQQQVFGEKQVLKMAEFLQDTGFQESAASLKKVDFAKAAQAAEKLGALNDKVAANRTVNELNDLTSKAGVINNGTVANINKSEINNLRRENQQIANSRAGFTVEENMAELTMQVQKITQDLLTNVPQILEGMGLAVKALETAAKGWGMLIPLITKSPVVKGIMNLFGKGKDD